jgi:hypothetical protein
MQSWKSWRTASREAGRRKGGDAMKVIVVAEETIYSSIAEAMFQEIIDVYGAKVLTRYVEEEKFRKKLFDLLYKNKINRYLRDRFEPVLKPKYSLTESLKQCGEEKVIVIFMNGGLQKFYSENKLNRIKAQYRNACFVLLLIDSSFQPQAQKALELAQRQVFDLVYTYNKADADRYHFLYYPTPYSRVADASKEPIPGAYFCGSEKGRTALLLQTARQLRKWGIPYRFDVYGDSKNSNAYFAVKRSGYKRYEEVVRDTVAYRCILDLRQESAGVQPGLSLRVFEALAYGRTLITNNPEIRDFPYYDPTCMHLIESPGDIRPEWFAEKGGAPYHGELSPLRFVADIQRRAGIP